MLRDSVYCTDKCIDLDHNSYADCMIATFYSDILIYICLTCLMSHEQSWANNRQATGKVPLNQDVLYGSAAVCI